MIFIENVKPLADFILDIDFNNDGEIIKKYYDLKKYWERHEDFIDLKRINGLYKHVKIELKGRAISWNDYLDIYWEELWNNGITNLNPDAFLNKTTNSFTSSNPTENISLSATQISAHNPENPFI